MRIGSLKQLTLGSFALSLVPLFVLLFQSQKDLTEFGEYSALESQHIVDTVSIMRTIENESANLERRMRQFQVVDSQQLADAIGQTQRQLLQSVTLLCEELHHSPDCQSTLLTLESSSASWLGLTSDALGQYIQNLQAAVRLLSVAVDEHLQVKLSSQQALLRDKQTQQAWLTSLFVLISLVLIVLASHVVLKPVNTLKQLIQAIAKQDGDLPKISQSGPKELVTIERDLHWLASRLSQLEHMRMTLLRHASHELKTPLASIQEGTSLLQEQVVGELNGAQKEVLSLLQSSTLRLNTLISKLLDYNLLLQQAHANRVQASLDEMISSCINDYALALQSHPVSKDIGVDIAKIDTELTRRILDNLLSNAVAHGTPNTPIYVKTGHEGELLFIDVANHGESIPEDKADSLFQPFVRGDHKRNDKVVGAGLGLSIVADCARIQQGSVALISVDYAPVCFRVTLPQRSGHNV